jgi:phosphoglycolate phosphatase
MVRGVIFDLDGTLLDTLDDIMAVVHAVMLPRGYPSRTREEVRLAVGMGVETLSRRLLPSGTDESLILEVAEGIRCEYLARGSVLTRPYEGVSELLSHLADIGMPMAVLSNKPQLSTEEAISCFFPSIPFRMVRGVIHGKPIKPCPESVIEVLAALGAPREEIAMIGDSDVDMRTAVAAGLLPIGVSWGFRERDLLLAHGASSIADSPREIPGLLFGQDRLDAVLWARENFPVLADAEDLELLEAAGPPDPSVYSRMGKVRWIVVHHSATEKGSVPAFRILHRSVNGWADVGYHFVIGNGTLSDDGEVEAGRPLWAAGAHTRGHNEEAIGICLVGDFTLRPPTSAQLTALSGLTGLLMKEYGLSKGDVRGHGTMPGCSTECPGSMLDLGLAVPATGD